VKAVIRGTGASVPSATLTNADLEALVDTSDEWIVARTGIRERRRLESGKGASELATSAGRAALASAGLQPSDLDMIVVATCTPDMPMPATAAFVQRDLRVGRPIPSFDMNAVCSGFLYGLDVVQSQIESGRYRCVLLVGVDVMTRLMDYQDRSTCVLFGDGAGAIVLVGEESERGIQVTQIKSDGEFWDLIHVPGGGSRRPASPYMLTQREQYMRMNGAQTFKLAVQSIEQIARDTVDAVGWQLSDVDHVIVHQANGRIVEAVAERLELPPLKLPTNVGQMGNTSAASVPVLLDQCNREGRLRAGDKLLCVAFGSGLTWGASAIVWDA
jgi:3-oxoacyl-[acyl-carrier-protein] synthase III